METYTKAHKLSSIIEHKRGRDFHLIVEKKFNKILKYKTAFLLHSSKPRNQFIDSEAKPK